MPLMDKLRGRNGQPKLPSHQLLAAIAEAKRGRAEFGATGADRKATVKAMFGLTDTEADNIATLVQSGTITREEIHDVLMLAEMGGADNPYSADNPDGDANILSRLGIT